MNDTCSTPIRLCATKPEFRITPTCSHTEDDWPTMHACNRHLAGVVYAASIRCTGHSNGRRVIVKAL